MSMYKRDDPDWHVSRLPNMKILIDHGADVNGWSKHHGTPLHCAVHFNRKEQLKYLLEHGADPNFGGKFKQSPAEMAKASGKLDLYKNLIGEEE